MLNIMWYTGLVKGGVLDLQVIQDLDSLLDRVHTMPGCLLWSPIVPVVN